MDRVKQRPLLLMSVLMRAKIDNTWNFGLPELVEIVMHHLMILFHFYFET